MNQTNKSKENSSILIWVGAALLIAVGVFFLFGTNPNIEKEVSPAVEQAPNQTIDDETDSQNNTIPANENPVDSETTDEDLTPTNTPPAISPNTTETEGGNTTNSENNTEN